MATKKAQKAPRHRSKPDPLAKAVGARVRRMRKERDFDFDAFVESVRLGRGYVSELERGLVVPGLHALAKIAAVLEVTVADLVVGSTLRERLFEVTASLSDLDVKQLLREAERRKDLSEKP